jgi:hypothetical protein
MRSTIRRTGRIAVVATTAVVSFGVLAGPAFADNDSPDLELTLSEPVAAAPGSTVDVEYTLTNVSDKATEGMLLNMSLPEYVSFAPASNCQETGENNEGGTLVSCNISGPEGKLGAGESLESSTPFQISPDAPADTDLGKLGALVVPLKDGAEETEDWTDTSGPNAAETSISTASGSSAGGWLSSLTGVFS